MALKVPGHHEVLDAVAGFALCVELLKSFGKNPHEYITKIAKGINNFAGGKRRSEIIGEFTTKSKNNVLVIDDYGHHPTAVKTTLEGFRSFYKKRKIIVDFMSHTYSRTQSLLEEFASCFLGYTMFYLTRKNISVALPVLSSDLGFSNIELGILGSALYFSYAIGKFVNGVLADRADANKFMTISILISAISNILFAISPMIFPTTMYFMPRLHPREAPPLPC